MWEAERIGGPVQNHPIHPDTAAGGEGGEGLAIFAVDVEDDEGGPTCVVLIGLFEQGLQNRGDGA